MTCQSLIACGPQSIGSFSGCNFSSTSVWSTPPSKERSTFCQERQKRRECQISSLSGCQTYVVGMLTMQCHWASQVKGAGNFPANKDIMHWAMLSCVDKSKTRVERPAVCRCHQLDKGCSRNYPEGGRRHFFVQWGGRCFVDDVSERCGGGGVTCPGGQGTFDP